jgi:circadian clock protein KaiB
VSSAHDSSLRHFELRRVELETAHYSFSLFVAGASDRSVRAIGNVRALFEFHLPGRYTLEVVDVYRDAARMIANNVLAAPTLIKEAPLPKRRLVGDLSDTTRVLVALGIIPASEQSHGSVR